MTAPAWHGWREEWRREGENFVVSVRHHTHPVRDDRPDKGGHRWCVYAHVYPQHPRRRRIEELERMVFE